MKIKGLKESLNNKERLFSRCNPYDHSEIVEKSVIKGITKFLSKELGNKKVIVNTVSPVLIRMRGSLKGLYEKSALDDKNIDFLLKYFKNSKNPLYTIKY